MAEVTHPELQLESLLGLALGRNHDTRVVDQEIEPVMGAHERIGELANGAVIAVDLLE